MPKSPGSQGATCIPNLETRQKLAALGEQLRILNTQEFSRLSTEVGKTAEAIAAYVAQQAADWAAASAAIAESLRSMNTALEKSEWLGRLGWTLPMNATSEEISNLLTTITDEASADAAFIEYFKDGGQERLRDLMTHTLENPSLRYWKPTLDEALWCLSHERYRVCTVALLPVLDGLCAVRFAVPQFHSKKARKPFLDARKVEAMADDSVTKWLWLSFIGFVDVLLQDVPFSGDQAPTRVLNRHAILHGRDIPAARLEDCLRLLLALDMITTLTDESVAPTASHQTPAQG